MHDDPDFSTVDELTDPAHPPILPAPGPGPAPGSSTPAPVVVIEYRRSLLARLAPPVAILAVAFAIGTYQRARTLHSLASRPIDPPRAVALADPKAVAVEKNEDKIVARPVNRAEVIDEAKPKADARPAEPGPTPAPAKPADAPAATAPLIDPSVTPAPSSTSDPAARKAAPVSPFELDADEGLKPVSTEPPASKPAEPPPSAPASSPIPVPAVGPSEPTPGGGAVDREAPMLDLTGNSSPQPAKPSDAAKPDPGPAAKPDPKFDPDRPVGKDEIMRDIEREANAIGAEQGRREQLKPEAQRATLIENLQRIEANRAPFRDDLRDAVKRLGLKAGDEIDRICDQYDRDAPKEIMDAYYREKRVFPRQLTRQGEIDIMRRIGVPEPKIFDFLAHKVHNTLRTRGGPRDEGEVRVRTAQLLLSYPVKPGPTAASTAKLASPPAGGGNSVRVPPAPGAGRP